MDELESVIYMERAVIDLLAEALIARMEQTESENQKGAAAGVFLLADSARDSLRQYFNGVSAAAQG